MSQTYPIQRTEDSSTLRLAWDNRRSPKDNVTFWALLVIWLVWAPLTVLMTCLGFLGVNPIFCAVWCVFGWLGTILIPHTLLVRWWAEWIELSKESFTHGCVGMLAPRPKIYPIETIHETALMWYHDGWEYES